MSPSKCGRPKTWATVTDEDLVEAVRFAVGRDSRDRGFTTAAGALEALSFPRPEQWATQPPPRNAAFGLGLIPPHGEGAASVRSVSARLRKLVRSGVLRDVILEGSRGGPAPAGFGLPS